MPAGTIALTNNSTAVTGSGTNFSSELKANDFIVTVVGGVTYTLGVQSVNSATSVTLTTAYNGPITSGLAWTAIPNAALVGITAQVAADVARAIRGLNLDKANWQQIFNGTGNVTVTLPDGTSWTGPAWNGISTTIAGISTTIAGKLDKTQNLNDLADKQTARTNLGLGSSATKDAGNDSGNVMTVGAFGLGTPDSSSSYNYTAISDLQAMLLPKGLHVWRNDGLMNGPDAKWNMSQYSPSLWFRAGDTFAGINVPYNTVGSIRIFSGGGTSLAASRLLWDSVNTTVDGSGFIKKASPIARLTADPEAMTEDFTTSFTLAGHGAVNEEAEGVSIERINQGVYRISGPSGLAKEGWQLEVPKDINGNRLCFVEVTEGLSGILVKVFKPKLDLESGGIIAGVTSDIPEGRWVDVRLEMPADSVYNVRQQELLQQQIDSAEP